MGQTHWSENNNYTSFDRATQSFRTNPIDKNAHNVGLDYTWVWSIPNPAYNLYFF